MRKVLTLEEVAQETAALVDQGHKRVLLIAGEAFPERGFGYLLDSIAAIYGVKRDNGEIRRVNINVDTGGEFEVRHVCYDIDFRSSRDNRSDFL